MARISNGIFKGLSGKVGNVVFRTRNGKTFVSALPERSKRKPTDRELAVRFKFGFMHKFLRPLADLYQQTYKTTSKGQVGFDQAFSDNYKELIAGEHPRIKVNFHKLVLSRGDVPLPKCILAASINPGMVDFIWTNDGENHPTDKVFVAAYCEKANEWAYNLEGPNREHCMYPMDVSMFKGYPVHVYIGFISSTGFAASDTYYAGMVNVR